MLTPVVDVEGACRETTLEGAVAPLRRLLPEAVLLPVDIGLLLPPFSFRYCEQFNWPRSAVVMPLLTMRPLLVRAGEEGGSFQLGPETDTLRL